MRDICLSPALLAAMMGSGYWVAGSFPGAQGLGGHHCVIAALAMTGLPSQLSDGPPLRLPDAVARVPVVGTGLQDLLTTYPDDLSLWEAVAEGID